MQEDGVHIGIVPESKDQKSDQKHDLLRRIPRDAEACTVLVGCLDFLEKPAMALVRLAEKQVLENLTEVPLPVRFVFILLGPEGTMDYHEVGRSLSTLMSNQVYLRCSVRKSTLRHVPPVKILIRLRFCAVWSESWLGAFWIAKDAKFLHADNEDSDQTVQMYRLIWIHVGRTCQKIRFLTFRCFVNGYCVSFKGINTPLTLYLKIFTFLLNGNYI